MSKYKLRRKDLPWMERNRKKDQCFKKAVGQRELFYVFVCVGVLIGEREPRAVRDSEGSKAGVSKPFLHRVKSVKL